MKMGFCLVLNNFSGSHGGNNTFFEPVLQGGEERGGRAQCAEYAVPGLPLPCMEGKLG